LFPVKRSGGGPDRDYSSCHSMLGNNWLKKTRGEIEPLPGNHPNRCQ
jgi:hypothetical protein